MRGIINKCTKVNWDNNFKPVGENDITDVVSTHIADIIDDRAGQVFSKSNTIRAIERISREGNIESYIFDPDEITDSKTYLFPEDMENVKKVGFSLLGHFDTSLPFDYGFVFTANPSISSQSAQLYSNNKTINVVLEFDEFGSITLTFYNNNEKMIVDYFIMIVEGENASHFIVFDSEYKLGGDEDDGEFEGWIPSQWQEYDINEVIITTEGLTGAEIKLDSLSSIPANPYHVTGDETVVFRPADYSETFRDELRGIQVSNYTQGGKLRLQLKY